MEEATQFEMIIDMLKRHGWRVRDMGPGVDGLFMQYGGDLVRVGYEGEMEVVAG